MARKRLYKGCKGGSIPSLGTHKESEKQGVKTGVKARKARPQRTQRTQGNDQERV